MGRKIKKETRNWIHSAQESKHVTTLDFHKHNINRKQQSHKGNKVSFELIHDTQLHHLL